MQRSPFNTIRQLSLTSLLLVFLLSAFAAAAYAQNQELSLADILIGLRSKKVTLPERNQILASAVAERGITFQLSPQIEKELIATGADEVLLAAIRTKSLPPKPVSTPTPVPVPTPTPPDASFYQKRAETNAGKGEFDSALADYTKAVEMKKDDPMLYVGRGRTLYNLRSYDLSVKDYDKAIELSPKTAVAFLNRGASYEKLGDMQKALADYRQASNLDAANETAISEVKRLEDAIEKANPPKPAEPVRPEFLNLGTLDPESAERLVPPTYSAIAKQSRIQGKVTVEVELDEEGRVVSAKATSGHPMLRQSAEDAAKRSKFKPARFNDLPIKARGQITYSFTL